MKNLMKYEFRNTWGTKLIILGLTVFLEVVFLAALFLNKEDITGLSAMLLTLLAIFGIMFVGIQSVITLHRDMNTKQSYMLFMTPNSSYKILGSKMLENGLSLIAAGVFFYALGFLDIVLLLDRYGELDQLWKLFRQIMESFNAELELNARSIAIFLVSMVSSWFCTLSTAYFADIVSTALLNGKRMNGLMSFALFIVLSLVTGWIQRQIPGSVGVTNMLLIEAGISLILSIVMYYFSARLMERSLSV